MLDQKIGQAKVDPKTQDLQKQQQKTIQDIEKQIQPDIDQAINHVSFIISQLTNMMNASSTTQGQPPFGQSVSSTAKTNWVYFQNRYKNLLSGLNGQVTTDESVDSSDETTTETEPTDTKTYDGHLTPLPPAPSSSYPDALTKYNQIQQKLDLLKPIFTKLFRSMNRGIDLINQISQTKVPWIQSYDIVAKNWKSIINEGYALGLTASQKRGTDQTVKKFAAALINEWNNKGWMSGEPMRKIALSLQKFAQERNMEIDPAFIETAQALAILHRLVNTPTLDENEYIEQCEIVDRNLKISKDILKDWEYRYNNIYSVVAPLIIKIKKELNDKDITEIEIEHIDAKEKYKTKPNSITNLTVNIIKKILLDKIIDCKDKEQLAGAYMSADKDIRDLAQKKLKQIKESSVKIAYPAMVLVKPSEKVDLDKWKKTAIKMESFSRAYKDYTFPQILYHFTKDWDMFERYNFKNWYRWNYKEASNNTMKKTAYSDFVAQDRVQQFQKKRQRLMNRINLVRKALHDFINSGLIAQKDSSQLYKIISMLEFEAMKIETPKIAAARVRRAGSKLEKLGFTEGKQMLVYAADELLNKPIVKVAAGADSKDAVEILQKIKQEMDLLSYSKHLDKLYNIKKRLEEIGRSTDSEAIEKIIRDDLSSLEKLNKKLVEVYTSLSKVPIELSMEQDVVKDNEQVIEVPIEVTEEEKPQPMQKAKAPIEPKVAPKPVVPVRPVAPVAAIQTQGVPNV